MTSHLLPRCRLHPPPPRAAPATARRAAAARGPKFRPGAQLVCGDRFAGLPPSCPVWNPPSTRGALLRMANVHGQAVAPATARDPEEGDQRGREAPNATPAPPRPPRGADVLIPPLNFSIVSKGVYRAGYPNEKNIPFLRKLKLRTVLCDAAAAVAPRMGPGQAPGPTPYSVRRAPGCQVLGDRLGLPRRHRGFPRRGARPPCPLPHGGKPGSLGPRCCPFASHIASAAAARAPTLPRWALSSRAGALRLNLQPGHAPRAARGTGCADPGPCFGGPSRPP